MDSDLRGRLKEITTRQWYDPADRTDPDEPGWEFAYDDANGHLLQITTPPPQSYSIDYSYGAGSTAHKIVSVEVKDTAAETLMRVDYMYYDNVYEETGTNPSNDLGSYGDLVQVKVTRMDSSGNPQVRYTQYRYIDLESYYYQDGILKAIYDHASIQRMIADSPAMDDPEDILARDDNGTNGEVIDDTTWVEGYASRAFEYHDSDEDTNHAVTAWSEDEDLEAAYGGPEPSDADDYYEIHEYRVKAEHIGGIAGCTSCVGGASRITRQYHYFILEQGQFWARYPHAIWHFTTGTTPNDINEVSMVVVEDTVAYDGENSDYPLYRRIYGLNDFGRKLREVLIENPAAGTVNATNLRCWCWAWTYVDADIDNDGTFDDVGDLQHLKHRVAEYRMPSAYNVTSNTQIRQFLDPYDDPETSDGGSGGYSNDNQVLRTGAGLIYVYEYGNAQGLRTGERVKKGSGGAANYVSAIDWGADAAGGSTNDQPQDRIIATYVYPTQTTTRGDTNRIQTKYEYDFWDSADTQLKKQVTKVPAVITAQNGADTASTPDPDNATVTAIEEYFDKAGRLRWTKDGEGYINYYSYHPSTGGLAYIGVDVTPTSLPSSADAPANAGKWVPSTDGDADGNAPTRDFTSPSALALVSTHEFDAQGRAFLSTDRGGHKHYTAYESVSGIDRVIQCQYWDTAPSPDQPIMPIHVSETDSQGRLAAEYTLAPSFALAPANGIPTSLGATPGTSDYQTLTRYKYDGQTGRVDKVERYHDAGGTTEFSNYNPTHYLYDAEGRVGATIEGVASDNYQVTVNLYDVLGRPTEGWRGVDTTRPEDYGDVIDSGWQSMGYAKVSNNIYDDGGIGDSHLSSAKSYYLWTGQYIERVYHRTFRGHVRGIEGRNGVNDFTPYVAIDVDWLGRNIATAQYTSEPSWTTLKAGYDAWVNHSSGATGRHSLTVSHFDDLGRVFRTDRYPGSEASRHFEINNYYDRNGRLVCTGDKYATHTEYAYDGAGRQYQTRTVTDVAETPYTSGKFNYRAPAPKPNAIHMTGGDDGVIELDHQLYGASGTSDANRVISQGHVEVNHSDTDGLSFSSTTSFVATTIHTWYDAAGRPETVGDYGAGGGTTGPGSWKFNTPSSRPGTAPTASADNVLVTQYGYDGASGRRNLVKAPDHTTTDPSQTKTFFDDLGRRLAVAENFVDYVHSPESGAGGGANNEEDRVTKWVYNGLGETTDLTAVNVTASGTVNQVTEYKYTNDHDASLVTLTKYPDGNTATSGSNQDNVQTTYDLDGRVKTRTDQRGVVMTYTYDNARRLIREGATTIPTGVDDHVKSIARTYDGLGRPINITSYANADGTGTVRNQVRYQYYWIDRVHRIYQSHEGAVSTSTTPRVEFLNYDTAHTNNVYTNGLRRLNAYYPVAAGARLEMYYGTADSLTDRLHRTVYDKLWGGTALNGNQANTTYCNYNGLNRVVRVWNESSFGTDAEREMFSSTGNYDGFDRFGRVVKFAWKKAGSGAVLNQTDYTYDHAGNRLTRNVRVDLINGTYADERDQKYEYDGLDRLVNSVQGTLSGGSITSKNFEQDFTLDQLGNWPEFKQDDDGNGTWELDQDRSHNAANEITDVSTWAEPAHDAAGNMTTMPPGFFAFDGYSLTYDAWNRLVRVYDVDHFEEIGKYEYDGLGQRIRIDLNGTTNDHDYYYNDQWQLLTEVKDSAVEAIYHWHPFYIDALAVRMRASDTHFFLHDANFNVTAAVDDSTNAVVERYAYSPYGEVTFLEDDFSVKSSQTSAIGNNHLYTGRERDARTGLQLNRNRYYAWHIGRWVNRDPIAYEGSEWNLYEYVASSSVNYSDPLGLKNAVRPWPGGPGTGTRPGRPDRRADPTWPGRPPGKGGRPGRRTDPEWPSWPGTGGRPSLPLPPSYGTQPIVDLPPGVNPIDDYLWRQRCWRENPPLFPKRPPRDPRYDDIFDQIEDKIPKKQCTCGFSRVDHKGNPRTDWDPAGLGSVTEARCRFYCESHGADQYKWGDKYKSL